MCCRYLLCPLTVPSDDSHQEVVDDKVGHCPLLRALALIVVGQSADTLAQDQRCGAGILGCIRNRRGRLRDPGEMDGSQALSRCMGEILGGRSGYLCYACDFKGSTLFDRTCGTPEFRTCSRAL